MGRWAAVVIATLIGFALAADWVVFIAEVRASSPGSGPLAGFLLRCAVSFVYLAIITRGLRR